MIKALIIEDENLIAKELQFKIAEVAPEVQIVQILPSLKSSYKWFMENAEPDLIFADIQLSDGTSFELFERYQLKCPVIFTTAYDEFAIKAFKVNGIDYLLKPVDLEDLRRAIDKSKTIIESKSDYPSDMQQLMRMIAGGGNKESQYKEKFIVNHRKQWLPIAVKDIACFVRDSLNYVYTFANERYILDFTTLEEIEELLDPRLFYRANRQCIINIEAIQSIKLHENSKLTLFMKAPLKMEQDVSREKAPSFKKWFDR